MRRYIALVLVVGLAAFLMGGCQKKDEKLERILAARSKRDPRYVDGNKYVGVWIGTPTEKNPLKEEIYLELTRNAVYFMDRDGFVIMGTFAFLAGELELFPREINGVGVARLVTMNQDKAAAVERYKQEGREPNTVEEFDKMYREAFGIFWRFTLTEDALTMKDTDRGPGLYVFKRAPRGAEVPSRKKGAPKPDVREEDRQRGGTATM